MPFSFRFLFSAIVLISISNEIFLDYPLSHKKPIMEDSDGDGNPDTTDPNPTVATANDDTNSGDPGLIVITNVLDNDDFLPNNDPNVLGTTTLSDTGTGTGAGIMFMDSDTGEVSYIPTALESSQAITIIYQVCSDDGINAPICQQAVLTITVSAVDLDEDGVDDSIDLDDDNDGILDSLESEGQPIPSGDADHDGIPNYQDNDIGVDNNNDGIVDVYDFDNDGISNHLDLDSDNDDIYDVTETGGIDTNNDGLADDTDGDSTNNNGIPSTAGSGNIPIDSGLTPGTPDHLDLDSDEDGVTDTQEIIDSTNRTDPCDFILPNQTLPTSSAWIDLDCDADGLTNGEETTGVDDPATPFDPNGNITNPLNPETDGDGVTDGQEGMDNTNPNDPCDLILTSQTVPPTAEWREADCDDDGLTNYEELTGVDDPNTVADPNEQTTDPLNEDTDGDGVIDGDEALDATNPNDSCHFVLNSQTVPTSVEWGMLDCDEDGINNGDEIENGTDPLDPCTDGIDCDGDGVTASQEDIDGTDSLNYCDYNITSQDLSMVSETWNNGDCDGDGVTNGQEILDNTNPKDLCDLIVASQNTTPSEVWNTFNCDGDEINNGGEIENGTDPLTANDFNFIQGTIVFDLEGDGCDATDNPAQNIMITVSNEDHENSFITDNNGEYDLIVDGGGMYTITPQFNNPNFTFDPPSVEVNFPEDSSPFLQDFCLTPTTDQPDVSITTYGSPIRPGFDVQHILSFQNTGTEIMDGTIVFNFDGDLMEYVSSSTPPDMQTTHSLIWNYTDLLPFSSRTINLVLNTNTPTDTPPVNIGDVLTFTASIDPIDGDITPEDNTYLRTTTVVGAYDPNDKTCIEGDQIAIEQVGEYLHYLLRFENLGTAEAINITVEDVIDTSRFDINTLTPLDASHSFITRIYDGNRVEFIFENINLPFDDANNDGYVAFKIRTLPSLQIDDVIENFADIFFDYNAPVTTNTAQTTIVDEILNINDFQSSQNRITIFPNPFSNEVNISSKNNITHIVLYDISGKIVYQLPFDNFPKQTVIDTSTLAHGLYFITVYDTNQKTSVKLIKQ